MADAFLALSVEDRREALRVAADRSGRPTHLLEKDVWVVWALATLFGSEVGAHLVFKGGTSLSKAYGVIQRFSEDVDLTYDIRAIAPDLIGENGEALPKNRSEEKRYFAAGSQPAARVFAYIVREQRSGPGINHRDWATLGRSSNGRTQDSESCCLGSSPSLPAKFGGIG